MFVMELYHVMELHQVDSIISPEFCTLVSDQKLLHVAFGVCVLWGTSSDARETFCFACCCQGFGRWIRANRQQSGRGGAVLPAVVASSSTVR